MCDAESGPRRLDGLLKNAGLNRAAIPVDIRAVRLVAQHRHIRPEFTIDMRRDLVGCAVGAVHDHLESLQVKPLRQRLLHELDVASFGVVDTKSLPDLRRRRAQGIDAS